MLVFWTLAALMIAVALGFVLVPLLRPSAATGRSQRDANLEVLRGQRREIEHDLASGSLPAQARDEALVELVARTEIDLAGEEAQPIAPIAKRPWVAIVATGVVVPAIAVGVYLVLGTPAGLDPARPAAADPPFSDQQIIAMVDNLATKVRSRPDDVQGWSLLARSLSALRRFPEAAEAYAHLAQLVPGDASILADYADALGMAQGGKLAGKPYELVKEALGIDPKHRKSLALAGTAALNAGDFAGALRHWEALAAQLAPGSEDEKRVRSIIEEVHGRALAQGKPLPPAPNVAKAAPAPERTVTGSVTVAPEFSAKVAAADTLFIFARAEGGPRVPLAVVRASAKELPRAFRLDDSMAMAPEMKLSSAAAVRIEARVSRSGNATPQPGDLVGTSAVVQPGARDVKIVIDRVVPQKP